MILPAVAEGEVRLGVAIEVPAPFGPALQRARVSFGDAIGASVPAHVTLLRPTVRPAPALGAVTEHLGVVAARHEPFGIALGGTATFRPVTPVVFVQLAAGIGPCEMLEADVRSGPLDEPTEFPFHPHVTVAHGVDDAALDGAMAALATFEARFQVRGFWLYEVHDDGGVTPVREFALGAG